MVIYHIKDLMLKKSVKQNTKMTYAKIAKEAGVSRVTLSRMSSRKGYSVTVDILEKLCRYFECTPNDLMTFIFEPLETASERE